MNNIMNNIKREAKKFWNDEDGMGVVEVVLITIVLVGLVVLFTLRRADERA